MRWFAVRALALVGMLAAAVPAWAELRGHGGPVRAVAELADGTLVSGSFDTAVIRWDVARGAAASVLRFHGGAVNAVVALPDGRFASAGEDAVIAIWAPGTAQPVQLLRGHEAPVAGLAAQAGLLASAGWDRTVRVWTLADGSARLLAGHADNVNGVAFLPDGRIASVGHDASLRIWPAAGARGDEPPEVLVLGAPLNGVAVASDGTVYAVGVDGQVHIVREARAEAIRVGALPLVALAVDATRFAAGGLRGSVSVFARGERRLLYTLEGPGLPVWSVAFSADGTRIITGGADRRVRLWDAATGRHIGAVAPSEEADPAQRLAGHPGAEVWRACQACHALTPDGGNRAGPSLHNLFGRRIASVAGYDYSPALRGRDITWTPETLGLLFGLGPNAYLPGTKMPEQRLGEDERAALADFLARLAAE